MNAGVLKWVLVLCLLNNLSGKYNEFIKATIIGLGISKPDFDTIIIALLKVNRFLKREEKTITLILRQKKEKPRKDK